MAAVTSSNDGKKAMADEELPDGDDGAEQRKEPQREPRAPQAKPKAARTGFFAIYKKGQGYWTRMGTVIGAGFLGCVVAFELYRQIPTFLPGGSDAVIQRNMHIALIAALVFLAAYAAWGYWFTNKATTVDFLIATDSEMKKVNWTSRKDLIASTKIVIIFMLIIALFLFGCDLLFGLFFHVIGVLKTWF